MGNNMKLTQEELKKVIRYDPETGIVTWKINKGRAKKGDIVCYDNGKGYVRLILNGNRYYVHRLAFLYMEGYLPENQIDHINRNPSDNRWCNLREVSHSCNMRNCNVSKNNKSGITGVFWENKRKKWVSQIKINRKLIFLGHFTNKFDAAKIRLEAEIKYGFPDCNTTSSAYQYIQKHQEIH